MNRQAATFVRSTDLRARFSMAEFVQVSAAGAFEGMKVELVRGELERINLPLSEHARVQALLSYLLTNIFSESGVQVWGEVGIKLGADTMRGADVTVVRHALGESRHLEPADILFLVEVANETLGRDLGLKMFDYSAAGIPDYWVVDVNARVVHVMSEPSESGYSKRGIVRFGEPLAVPGGGGATIQLD